jgi:hypothetical protein
MAEPFPTEELMMLFPTRFYRATSRLSTRSPTPSLSARRARISSVRMLTPYTSELPDP